jgi:glycerophosphoryl diester phosphodiesterase
MENSWEAFEAAVAEWADAIECDVQGTRDGDLVIRHDLMVGNRRVAECSVAEIEAMEPGLVRLADLLAWAPRANIGLLVRSGLDVTLQSAMLGANPWQRVVIGSFHAPALALKARTLSARH